MVKKLHYIIAFLVLSNLCFANLEFSELSLEENIIIDENYIDNSKFRISILKPCFYGKYRRNDVVESLDDKLNEIVNNKNDVVIYKDIESDIYNFVFNEIYKKIISNLEITELYDLSYQTDSCKNINNYIDSNDDTNISDYILSENLNNFDFVVSTNLFYIDKDKLKLQIMVWDILEERFLDGRYYILSINKENNNSYRLSNIISDFIFKATTKENFGLFDSKIAYVSETGNFKNRDKQIAVMNFDGSKNIKITDSNNLKLTPAFSKYKSNEIFYLEYLKDGPFIIRHNLNTGNLTKISSGQIMTSAASVNPNTNKNQIIIAGTEDTADTNLYLFDFKRMVNTKLTDNNSINTAASFSPDGKNIVYVSDRTGERKLYKKNLETDEEDLISRNNGIYDKPSWSPDGKLISFVKIANGDFYLGLMTPDGDSERYIMKGFLIEGVKWSPNSRYLIYTKQLAALGNESIPRIYIVDILTRNEYKLNIPKGEGASDPDWIMNF